MKKKKKLLLLTMMALMTLSFIACSSSDSDASKNAKTFTVGFDQDFPPMGFVGDDGEFTGFDLGLAAEVAKPPTSA